MKTTKKNTTTVTPDEQNDAIRAQVEREMPRPIGGFETDEEEELWRVACNRRFLELCRQCGIDAE